MSEWTIDGVGVWPLLRVAIAAQLYRLNHTGTSAPPARGGASALSLMRALWRDRAHGASLFRRAQVVLFGIATGKTKIAGSYYSQYTDPLQWFFESRGVSALHVERDRAGALELPRYQKSLVISYRIWRPLLRLIAKIHRERRKQILLPDLGRLRAELLPYFDRATVLSESFLTERFISVVVFKQCYGLLLRMLRPRLVVMHNFYSSDSMGIAWACRKLAVPCFDYQHGVQGELHHAYAPWRNMPARGYDLLPTGFLTWDEGSAANLRSWVLHGAPVYTIGNLWHRAYQELPMDLSASVARIKERARGRPVVLFTAQDYPPRAWLLDSMRAMKDVFWCLRLHPQHRELEESVRESLGDADHVDIEISTEAPLPMLLQIAALHVTGSSSVVSEADALGIASVVTEEVGLLYFAKLVESGRTFGATDAQAFTRVVRDRVTSSGRMTSVDQYPDQELLLRSVAGPNRGSPLTPETDTD